LANLWVVFVMFHMSTPTIGSEQMHEFVMPESWINAIFAFISLCKTRPGMLPQTGAMSVQSSRKDHQHNSDIYTRS